MKQLKELIQDVKALQVIGDADRGVADLFLDSRQVIPGSLFCAIKGSAMDGHQFIDQAVQRGASTILCEVLPEKRTEEVTYLLASEVRKALGAIAAAFFDRPSQNLKVVGITGTNGKTSIATWLYQLVRKMGYPAGLLSTIRILINGEEFPASHTTPDVISINRYLAKMVDTGCEYAFMEVSSHALDQGRTEGIEFAGAVFTNLTRDHLDYHKDFPSYLKAKKLLFDQLGKAAFALVNTDDRNGEVMLQNCQAVRKSYALRKMADYHVKIIEKHHDGTLLRLNQDEVWVGVLGSYNALNLAAVFGVAVELGLARDELMLALSSLRPVEGRLEIIDLGKKITGIVDYAHTPDALDNVLQALNEVKKSGSNIITVVGAGGDRDPGKRPVMAQAALKGSDQVILTSDNPRTEDPEKILDDMESGIGPDDETRFLRITNRLAAIRTAFKLAQPGDIILVAGKGHENYQEINGVRHPFDDFEELEKLKYKE